jgi:hypothetical protein
MEPHLESIKNSILSTQERITLEKLLKIIFQIDKLLWIGKRGWLLMQGDKESL